MFQQIYTDLVKQGKPHHYLSTFLIFVAIGFSSFTFSQTEKLDKDKADIEIVKEMLGQSRELIELQRNAQQIQMAELKRVEAKIDDRVSTLEQRLSEVKGDQRVLEIKQDATMGSVLEKLDRLSEEVSRLNNSMNKRD